MVFFSFPSHVDVSMWNIFLQKCTRFSIFVQDFRIFIRVFNIFFFLVSRLVFSSLNFYLFEYKKVLPTNNRRTNSNSALFSVAFFQVGFSE